MTVEQGGFGVRGSTHSPKPMTADIQFFSPQPSEAANRRPCDVESGSSMSI